MEYHIVLQNALLWETLEQVHFAYSKRRSLALWFLNNSTGQLSGSLGMNFYAVFKNCTTSSIQGLPLFSLKVQLKSISKTRTTCLILAQGLTLSSTTFPYSPLSCMLHANPNKPISSWLPSKSTVFFPAMVSNTSIPNSNVSLFLLATDST